MLNLSRLAAAVAVLSLSVPVVAMADEAAPSLEALAAQLKLQQAQIEALTAQVESQEKAVTEGGTFGKTSLGGYGEAYFKSIDDSTGKKKDEFDAYRLVLFVGHQFSDKVRFASELEIEHAYVKDTDTDTNGSTTSIKKSEGYVAVEQLFLEYQYADKHRAAAGQLLVPVGILNETHEPDTFYGVFRAPVEREIVPGTWYETGVMFSGDILPGLSYDAMMSSGLKTTSGNIKDGRQRGSKADGADVAYTARVKYTGIAGLELGLTMQEQQDMAQGGAKVAGTDLDASMIETHVAYTAGPFGLRALYAEWDMNENALLAADQKRAEQKGWYVEPSWKVVPTVGVFARYSEWDNEAGDAVNTNWQEKSVGVSWWLHERAVVKADLQRRDDPKGSNKDQDGFNVGIGFSF
ncbi:MAG TPA: porin [Moraxellaceae bacterium]|nr:porin [Moraxellaceae bacterium]